MNVARAELTGSRARDQNVMRSQGVVSATLYVTSIAAMGYCILDTIERCNDHFCTLATCSGNGLHILLLRAVELDHEVMSLCLKNLTQMAACPSFTLWMLHRSLGGQIHILKRCSVMKYFDILLSKCYEINHLLSHILRPKTFFSRGKTRP